MTFSSIRARERDLFLAGQIPEYSKPLREYEQALCDHDDATAETVADEVLAVSMRRCDTSIFGLCLVAKRQQRAVDALWARGNRDGAIRVCAIAVGSLRAICEQIALFRLSTDTYYSSEAEREHDLMFYRKDLAVMYGYLAYLKAEKRNQEWDAQLRSKHAISLASVQSGDPRACELYAKIAGEIARIFPVDEEVRLYTQAVETFEQVTDPSIITPFHKRAMAQAYEAVGRFLFAAAMTGKGDELEARRLFTEAINLYHDGGMPREGARIEAEASRLASSLPGNRTIPSQEWSKTPYDGLTLTAVESRQGVPTHEKTFDMFISYKSEDVGIARHLAELLIAGGLRVWFAEYLVLLAARERFDEAIDEGLGRSRYGIVFTNDRYIRSPYCRHELECLLDPVNCGAPRVLEVKLGSTRQVHLMYPDLDRSAGINFKGDMGEVLQLVRQTTSLRIEHPSERTLTTSCPSIFRDERFGYRIDISGWQLLDPGGFDTGYGTMGPQCTQTLGGHRASWNLIVGSPAPATRATPKRGQIIDDRACFNQIVEVARAILPSIGGRCTGVHMLFSKEKKYSQLALTYWFQSGWTRRYSVVLPDPQTGKSTEFAFTFGFHAPFREYCQHSHMMDRVVESLEW